MTKSVRPMTKDVKSRIRDRSIKQRIRRERQAIAKYEESRKRLGYAYGLADLQLYTMRDAMLVLNMSRWGICEAIKNGSLKASKTCDKPNGHFRFTRRDLLRFNSERKRRITLSRCKQSNKCSHLDGQPMRVAA